jgi:hypothetical protein
MGKAEIKRRYLIVPGAILAIAAGGAPAAADDDDASGPGGERAAKSSLTAPAPSAERARPGATRPETRETDR